MWVKICGVTRVEDAETVCEAGADAIGLNFFPQSSRFVTVPKADAIRHTVQACGTNSRPAPSLVGVFVNSTPAETASITLAADLDIVQFHGDQSDEDMAQFRDLNGDIAIIRAVRCAPRNAAATRDSIVRLHDRIGLFGCLLDAWVPGEFGGTGRTVSPEVIEAFGDLPPSIRLILAGGLTASNVRRIVTEFRPWGVDTASGVESQPGIKDSAAVHSFVAAARTVGPAP
ncbi:MAG: phosphoribosylanthranilate isomerase [Planctomycetaceae bacterium]|nr:phosphoribosylanthranilate isomerase [Planctomycetaceae bacterium]